MISDARESGFAAALSQRGALVTFVVSYIERNRRYFFSQLGAEA